MKNKKAVNLYSKSHRRVSESLKKTDITKRTKNNSCDTTKRKKTESSGINVFAYRKNKNDRTFDRTNSAEINSKSKANNSKDGSPLLYSKSGDIFDNYNEHKKQTLKKSAERKNNCIADNKYININQGEKTFFDEDNMINKEINAVGENVLNNIINKKKNSNILINENMEPFTKMDERQSKKSAISSVKPSSNNTIIDVSQYGLPTYTNRVKVMKQNQIYSPMKKKNIMESLEIYRKKKEHSDVPIPNIENKEPIKTIDREENFASDYNINSSTKGTTKSISKEKSSRHSYFNNFNSKYLHSTEEQVNLQVNDKEFSGSKSVNYFAKETLSKTKDGDILITVNMKPSKTVRPFNKSLQDNKPQSIYNN